MQRTVERQAVRMHQMMNRLNVDAIALVRLNNGDVYAEARSRCLSCLDSDRCQRWLDGDGGLQRSPDFCPIVHLLSACRNVVWHGPMPESRATTAS